VLGVFSRAQLTENEFGRLRTFADSAAVAITNARRFQALRASEQRLQDIIDNTTAVIFVKDLELRYLLVNREYERRYRVRREEIRGKSDFDIHPREVAEPVRANDLQVIETNEASRFEEVVPSVDGELVYLLSFCCATARGTVRGLWHRNGYHGAETGRKTRSANGP
jgi:PAS domain S-box-containing protein